MSGKSLRHSIQKVALRAVGLKLERAGLAGLEANQKVVDNLVEIEVRRLQALQKRNPDKFIRTIKTWSE